eukprot:Phypoly_transcript_17799.p1 GENE.Phypoly_transcript_17799~~Phypoly_transcript_17799.p1  ORF type:complete len:235 (+),score=30.46 Phypoly_transcript_17799:84-788(+)
MAQYDSIAKPWEVATNSFWWTKISVPNHQALFDEIKGKKALDLACGEGLHARYLLEKGASKVVGVDISEAQIQLARSKDPNKSIEWICKDVMNLGKIGEFDIISAAYLLNYAKDKNELLEMCKNIKLNLSNSGKFYCSTVQPPKNKEIYPKHNLTLTFEDFDGTPVTVDATFGDVKLQLKYFYHSHKTYEWAFKTAGFSHFEWVPFKMFNVAPEETEIFKDLANDLYVIGIIAW